MYLSEITATTLTFRARTAGVTYCADVTLFLHSTASSGLSLIAAFFLRRFLAFYCFKCYLASFSRCQTVFSPNMIPLKHAEQEQIDAKCPEKKFDSAGGSLIIVNTNIKETENLIFFSV